jgi:hypothetical protein
MLKTEAQLARTELEWKALDATFSTLRYLGFSPKTDTWKRYLGELEYQSSTMN